MLVTQSLLGFPCLLGPSLLPPDWKADVTTGAEAATLAQVTGLNGAEEMGGRCGVLLTSLRDAGPGKLETEAEQRERELAQTCKPFFAAMN